MPANDDRMDDTIHGDVKMDGQAPRNRLEDILVDLLVRGEARSLHDAEEKYLDAAIPEMLALLAGPLRNDELAKHPLLNMVRAHGSRGWEDSIL